MTAGGTGGVPLAHAAAMLEASMQQEPVHEHAPGMQQEPAPVHEPGARRLCGLLGERLGHSFSPMIHACLGDYDYELFAVKPDELDAFFAERRFDAINVTIPYKRVAMEYCSWVSDAAKAAGCVNTVVKGADGRLRGYNTDAYGFAATLRRLGFDPRGKKAAVLGSGGAAGTARYVLTRLGARAVVNVSRGGDAASRTNAQRDVVMASYADIASYSDAELLVNATPVGMYPGNGESPLGACLLAGGSQCGLAQHGHHAGSQCGLAQHGRHAGSLASCPAEATASGLEMFPRLEALVDLIYNPAATKLMADARRLGVTKVANGLLMLVAQAVAASRLFVAAPASPSAESSEAAPAGVPALDGVPVPDGVPALDGSSAFDGALADVGADDGMIDEIAAKIREATLNVALIGMPGCGKSTAGRALAEALGRLFVDTDVEIVRRLGKPIPLVFAEDGEEAFRAAEAAAIAEAGKLSGAVIATGGGVVTRPANLESLRQNGVVAYIRRDLLSLPSGGRPLSIGVGVDELARRRLHLYDAWKDFAVDVSEDPQATAALIWEGARARMRCGSG